MMTRFSEITLDVFIKEAGISNPMKKAECIGHGGRLRRQGRARYLSSKPVPCKDAGDIAHEDIAGARAEEGLSWIERRALLAKCLLADNLAITEGENVYPVGFDALAVGLRRHEGRLGDDAIIRKIMFAIQPLYIRHGSPGVFEALPDRLTAFDTGTVGFITRDGIEDDVVGKVFHYRVDIMAVKGVEEVVQILISHSFHSIKKQVSW